MKTVAEKVRASVMRRKRGIPFSASSLYEFGARSAVRQALARLAEEGILERVARGIYVRPTVNEYVGKVPPEPLLIAEAKTKVRREPVMISGLEAARRLGLSTQMQVREVFLSTGAERKFMAMGRRIVIKHVRSGKIKPGDDNVSLATAALIYLGRERVTSEVIRQIRVALKPNEFDQLLSYSRSMPEWVQTRLEGA